VRVEEINARIIDVERTRQQYQQLISKEQSVQRELETKTQDVDLLKRDLQTAKKKSTALSETSIASAQVARARKLLSEAMMIIDPESPLAEEPVTPSIWTRFRLFKRRL
jgi:cell division FtsZ-interacting protein ZapD